MVLGAPWGDSYPQTQKQWTVFCGVYISNISEISLFPPSSPNDKSSVKKNFNTLD